MDGQEFDRLTQGFSRLLSRRRFGATLAALGLGSGLASPPAKAKKKKKKKKPKPCPSGQTRCGTACVDTQSNVAHCGGCGQACPGGQACANGTCQGGGCSGSQTLCGGECVNTQSDRRHCGGCGVACTGNQICSGGACDDAPECTSQAQCGGSSSFNDLVCSDGRGTCHQCCSGGNLSCPGEHVCSVYVTPAGIPAGICNCPTGSQQCRTGSFQCVVDPQFDDRKCGLDCVDCTTRDPGSECCNGFCARGCAPGTQCGSINGPCGPNCSMCPEGTICCNRGPGTTAQCIPNLTGFCYVN